MRVGNAPVVVIGPFHVSAREGNIGLALQLITAHRVIPNLFQLGQHLGYVLNLVILGVQALICCFIRDGQDVLDLRHGLVVLEPTQLELTLPIEAEGRQQLRLKSGLAPEG